ncbi:MAG: hypothetical protein ACWIPI_08380, partial [Polaribacter sp.]
RYLTKVTTYNSNNESLKPQSFEYNTTGEFKGTIHKIKNTTGSEVTYSYENKFLFKNNPIEYNAGDINGIPLDKDPGKFADFEINERFFVEMKELQNIAYVYSWNGNSLQGKTINFDDYAWVKNYYYKKLMGDNYFGFVYENTVQLAILNKDGYSWKTVKFELPFEKMADKWRNQLTCIVRDNYILIISKATKEILPLIYNGNGFIVSEKITLSNSIFFWKEQSFLVSN